MASTTHRVRPSGICRIINISSVLGRFGVPGYTAYCASKHGVIGFTKALALELAAREITVNAICPGWVDTNMATEGLQAMADGLQVELDEARRMAMSAVPLGRMLQPEEIGSLVVWLASKGAAAMTGQAISHCGGQVMW
jgi:NAD(P)-dependent dehydrogenase (short-subunit alcohol dehydrogenase family)